MNTRVRSCLRSAPSLLLASMLLRGALLFLLACESGEQQRIELDRLDAAVQDEPEAAADATLPRDASLSQDAASDASQANDAGFGSLDAAVMRDLCGQTRPATPGASGIASQLANPIRVIDQHPAVAVRGPGVSARLAGRALWLFAATFDRATPAKLVASSSFSMAGLDRPYMLDEAKPDAALPAALLPDLPDDLAQLRSGESLAYALGSLVPVGLSDALLFYTPRRRGPAGESALGTRVARVHTDFNAAQAVPESAPLFPSGAPSFRSGLLGNDGYVYLFGCPQTASGTFDCKLARAPLGRATEPPAYQYRSSGIWSNDPSVARVVLSDLSADLSVSFNDYLQSYLAVSFVGSSERIRLLTAPRPEGPWTTFGELSVPLAIAGARPSQALEHGELASSCGRKLALTYLSALASGQLELRPLDLELR